MSFVQETVRLEKVNHFVPEKHDVARRAATISQEVAPGSVRVES